MRKLFAVGSSRINSIGRLQLSADEEEHHVGSDNGTGGHGAATAGEPTPNRRRENQASIFARNFPPAVD